MPKQTRNRRSDRKKHKLHDEFVRNQLADKTMARDLIQQFMPPEIVEKLDFSGLERDETSYVNARLASYFSDLVWLCPYKNNQNKKIRIALLLEHKSYLVEYPHFQLLRYMLEIWERNIKDKEKLLPVLPIIFYHGEKEWEYRNLSSYFEDIDEDLLAFLPDFRYGLIDLSLFSDRDIMNFKMGFLKNILLALRFSRDRKYLKENFKNIFYGAENFIETPEGVALFQILLLYLFRNTDFSENEVKEMIESINENSKDMAASTYEKMIERDIQKGIEKGKIENTKAVVQNAYNEGIKIDMIARLVNLPKNKVIDILKEAGLLKK